MPSMADEPMPMTDYLVHRSRRRAAAEPTNVARQMVAGETLRKLRRS
jgi:hypothetical protein